MSDITLARITSLISRLEEMERRLDVAPAAPEVEAQSLPPTVAPGELIESAWGNQVSDSIYQLWAGRMVPNVFPTGNVDISAASLTDWLLTSIDVPTWARVAIIHYNLSGFFEPNAGTGAPMYLQGRLGTQNGYPISLGGQGQNVRMALTWMDAFTVPGVGTQTIGVRCARPGSQVLRADTETRLIMDCTFLI